MSTTYTWDQVVSAITGVVNRGNFSRIFTPTMNAQSQSGDAGYYSSVYTACNGVGLSGDAITSHVLGGSTFYSNSLTKQTGTMINAEDYKNATLTSVDGRPVLVQTLQSGDSKVWCLNNSDGVSRLCIQVPREGFYSGTCCIGVLTSTIRSLLPNDITIKILQLSGTSSSNQMAFVDNNKGGAMSNCYYITINPGLTSYMVTYVEWNYNGNVWMCVGCGGSVGNVNFAMSVFCIGSAGMLKI